MVSLDFSLPTSAYIDAPLDLLYDSDIHPFSKWLGCIAAGKKKGIAHFFP